jgi:hypothetical protein
LRELPALPALPELDLVNSAGAAVYYQRDVSMFPPR